MMEYVHLKVLLILFLSINLSNAQSKKSMTPEVYSIWKKISSKSISDNGNTIIYTLSSETADDELFIYDKITKHIVSFPRAKDVSVQPDGRFVIYLRHLSADSIKMLKRKKIKSKDFPKDSLVIYNVANKNSYVIPDVLSYQSPKNYCGYLAYKAVIKDNSVDTITSKLINEILIIRDLITSEEDTIHQVKNFFISDDHKRILYDTNIKGEHQKGIYDFNIITKTKKIIVPFPNTILDVAFNEKGENCIILTNPDTTEMKNHPVKIWYDNGNKKFSEISASQIKELPENWTISKNKKPIFTEDNSKIFFGVNPPIIAQDTNLLPEEIVNVEIWTSHDQVLYTQQENDLEDDLKKFYTALIDLSNPNNTRLIQKPKYTSLDNYKELIGNYTIAQDRSPYEKYLSWNGYRYSDIFLIDLRNGSEKLVAQKEPGNPTMSPDGKFIVWFNLESSEYKIYDIASNKLKTLLSGNQVSIVDEENDSPQFAYEYGVVGWTTNDDKILIYDKYDIWEIDPNVKLSPKRITKGREQNIEYRLIKLDKEEKSISRAKDQLLKMFNKVTLDEGYSYLTINNEIKVSDYGPFNYSYRPLKAKNANVIVTTKESYEDFPDILVSDSTFTHFDKISNANPQQANYNWGSIEKTQWTNAKGEKLRGLVVKPENFDPNKKYPLLVNFYERSSEALHNHRAPYAHRSTINYTYYASKGFVLFNPDVTYDIGYPGQSCYDDVVSGIEALSAKGFIDISKIGVQGHSWGGYQVAHLLTKTNIFACAESGAPVVNMISAYGGIRWGSGMSRMFQYERTQSRLGATLWENPELYLENSPIFNMDKVNTPVLILHNDEDGAVPWYQGIEYITALRRLGKPAWFLNYNNEPHWPVKWQNRLDFNIRMEQFFDHFLLDNPLPLWMKEGVPAIEKGINQRLE